MKVVGLVDEVGVLGDWLDTLTQIRFFFGAPKSKNAGYGPVS
jgi:hypothetical protein